MIKDAGAIERFCLEMLKPGMRATDAFITAYPRRKTNRRKTLIECASRLAARPEVAARILELRNKLVTEPGIMGVKEALLTASHIARGDPRKCFTAKGILKKPGDIDDLTAIAITEYSEDKVKLASKLEAVKILLQFNADRGEDPNDAQAIEDESNAFDWGRRIAFALRSAQKRQAISSAPST